MSGQYRRPRTRLGRILSTWWLWTTLVGCILGFALYYSVPAHAVPLPPNCVQQPWWRGEALRFVVRTLCDGPIRADSSWMRSRNFYGAAYYVPVTCSWGYYGGSCTGGYWRPEFDSGVETYPVTDSTVLPDEPGHIGAAGGQAE